MFSLAIDYTIHAKYIYIYLPPRQNSATSLHFGKRGTLYRYLLKQRASSQRRGALDEVVRHVQVREPAEARRCVERQDLVVVQS